MGNADTVGAQADLDSDGELPDDWLVFALVDTLYRSEDAQHVRSLFILSNRLLGRVMVLLVAE